MARSMNFILKREFDCDSKKKKDLKISMPST